MMSGVEGLSYFRTNSKGIRGEEFPQSREKSYLILTVGGSTTENFWLDQAKAWPALVQMDLVSTADGRQVWVGNVGKAGMTTRDHVLQVRYLLPQYPKIDVLILLAGINDFELRLRQGSLYDPNYLERPGAEAMQMRHAFSLVPEEVYDLPWYKKTGLWRVARAIRSRIGSDGAANQIIGLAVTEVPLPRSGVQNGYDRPSFVADMRHLRQNAVEILGELPDLTSALGEYEKNLNRIIDTAQERGVRIVLVTHPAMWRADLNQYEKSLLWFGAADLGFSRYYSFQALAKGMNEYNARMLKVCAERRVECIDLAAQLPKNTSAFFDDVHFNENGARLVTRAIASALRAAPPFVLKASSSGR